MTLTGSLCPTIKASEVLGDKWTILILRELFLGSNRYNQFQKAIPRISPTMLSARLKKMEQDGLLIRKTKVGQKGGEYHLTKSAWELAPIVDSLARWGLRWARDQLCDADLDSGTFMWDFHRTVNTDALPDGRHTLGFHIQSDQGGSQWWIVVEDKTIDLCNQDPGYEVDLYITSGLVELAAVWMGDVTIKAAIDRGDVVISGQSFLVKSVSRWFPKSSYAEVRPEQVTST